MKQLPLINPKQVTIIDLDGNELIFNISRIPAIAAREFITQYPTTAIPKIGDYQANEELMIKMMKYIEIVKGDQEIRLITSDLINNHVPDGESLMKLEAAMLNENTNFLNIGRVSKELNGFSANIKQFITQTLTSFAASSSPKSRRRSKNSAKKST